MIHNYISPFQEGKLSAGDVTCLGCGTCVLEEFEDMPT
jgi:hypothetical protein